MEDFPLTRASFGLVDSSGEVLMDLLKDGSLLLVPTTRFDLTMFSTQFHEGVPHLEAHLVLSVSLCNFIQHIIVV